MHQRYWQYILCCFKAFDNLYRYVLCLPAMLSCVGKAGNSYTAPFVAAVVAKMVSTIM